MKVYYDIGKCTINMDSLFFLSIMTLLGGPASGFDGQEDHADTRDQERERRSIKRKRSVDS